MIPKYFQFVRRQPGRRTTQQHTTWSRRRHSMRLDCQPVVPRVPLLLELTCGSLSPWLIMMALTYVDDYDDDKDKLDYYGDDDDADRQTQSWCPWVEMSRPPNHRWSWEECWRPRRERSPHCRRTFRSPVFYIKTLLKWIFFGKLTRVEMSCISSK